MPLTQTLTFISLTTLLVLATAFLYTPPVHAQTQGEVCNLYTPSVTTPTGYGASYNVFNQSELMISIYCNEDKSVTVTAGNNDPLTYVYNQGYYYANNQWNNFTYTCSDELIASAWCTQQATKTLTNTPTSGTTYLVSYTCQWRNNTWNCGCHNSACTTNHWQLQGWTIASGGGGSDGGGVEVPAGANILWEQDFDGVPQVSSAQILTLEKAEQFFGTPGTVASLGESNEVLLSPDPANSGRGNVLELFHPKDDCRFGFRAEVKRGLSLSEVYYSYDVYVKPDYITPFGMKNGLRIQSQSSSNGTGVYYTSAASMHSDAVTRGGENSLVSYIYQEEGRSRAGKGKSYEWDGTADGQANLPFGRWANIKVRTKINTFDSSGNARADGEVQAWLDGEEVFLKRDFTFTESDMPGAFRSLLFLNYYGGDCRNSDQWFSPQDQSEFYDNLVFWTE